MEPLQFPNQDNAFKDMLGTRYWGGVVAHCNLWHAIQIKLPTSSWGTANALVSNTGVIFDFTKMKAPFPIEPFRLQLINMSTAATGSTAAVAKYRVRLGKIGGYIADPGMTDPGDDPIFTKTISSPADGWYVIYCKLPMSYSGAGLWTPSAGTIHTGTVGAALPANDDNYFYVEIGQLKCTSGVINQIAVQASKNDVAIGRAGNSTSYVDSFVQVLSS